MPTLEQGPTVNVNALIQHHLNTGGRLELTVQRNGKNVLDFLPSEETLRELEAEIARLKA